MRIVGYVGLQLLPARSAGSVLYRATRERDGRRVVLKTPRGRSTRAVHDRYTREHEILEQVRGPGVIEALGLEEHDGSPVLVLADDGAASLDGLLGRGALRLEETLHIGRELATTLARVHLARVVHKDVNPSNILVSPDGRSVTLIDFGIASRVSRERATGASAETLEGTLAYLAPEQSGRMNRSVDARSDLYALGVTLYELLVGRVPFDEREPLALVHAHMARVPQSPRQRNGHVPEIVSDIVMRLLAKSAEDRYQTASGLAADLARCLDALAGQDGRASDLRPVERDPVELGQFDLGAHDVRARLEAPSRLYGRGHELDALLAAFDRCQAGGVEVVRVSGEPGVGKTALVLELRERITPRGGALASGKCDQLDRSEPFSVLAQAFRQRVRMVLSESDAELSRVAALVRAMSREHLALLTTFVPELERLLEGPLPPPAALPAAESEARLAIAARRFVRCLSSRATPLVLFLDDLQWADAATLRLLSMIATDPEGRHVLLIAAHRDQQVGPGHPLLVSLDDVASRGAAVSSLPLEPLSSLDVTAFVADTLRTTKEKAASLAELLFARTAGNPFFLLQMLESLEEEGAIQFDASSRRFVFDDESVRRAAPRADVAELLAQRLDRLAVRTQRLVETASLVGAQLTVGELAAVEDLAPEAVTDALEPAVEHGLLDVLDARSADRGSWRYGFVHDRVQQIARSRVEADRASDLHLRLGRMLLPAARAHRDARLFTVVDHLDAARARVVDPTEREELARLNLEVGIRARDAGAYAAALAYLEIGRSLEEPARSPLAISLTIEAAEAAYLATDFVKMERLTDEVLHHAPELLSKVRAHEIRINASVGRNDLDRALAEGIEVLGLLGLSLPLAPHKGHVLAGLARTRLALTGWSHDRVATLPLATRPEGRAAMRIAMGLCSSAYYARPDLLPMLVFAMVRLTLSDGVSPESSFAFAVWALVMASLGAIETGYGYGQLALRLRERVEDTRTRHRAEHLHHAHLAIWKHPYAEARAGLRRTYEAGYTRGDLEYSAFSAMMSCTIGLYAGNELGALADEMRSFRDAIRSLAMGTSLYTHEISYQAALCLRAGGPTPWRMEGPIYDERTALAIHEKANDATNLFSYRVAKALLCLVFGQLDEAEPLLAWNRAHADLAASTVISQSSLYLDALVSLRRAARAKLIARTQILLRVDGQLATMRKWAALCPANWAHRVDLVLAERAALAGHVDEATSLFERATTGARGQGDLSNEALACESAAALHGAQGHSTAEQAYLVAARNAYERWGATAKVAELERAYPELEADRVSIAPRTTTTTTGTMSGVALDLAAVISSAQSIGKEIELSRLIQALVRIALQAAGASRAVLLLERRGALVAVAEGLADAELAVRTLDLALDANEGAAPFVAEGVVRYVQRSRMDVVVDDAQIDASWRHDPYVSAHGVRSLLCVPVEQQGKLAAVLHLEHARAAGVFTRERVALLRVLASQAAISLENARLYEDLRVLADAQARFVPNQFLESLSRPSIVEVRLGDNVRKTMTVLFSDIRGFTPLVESMRPEEHIGFINEYLRFMEPPILNVGGFVDSYIGDAIMALFDGKAGGADQALDAGVGMSRALARLNDERGRAGAQAIRIGIGLHTGWLTLGTIGGPERIKCGVIGDSVNLAARLEALTKQYEATLLVSDALLAHLSDPSRVTLRVLDRVRMRGSAIPVTVHEVIDAEPAPLRDAKRTGLAAYTAGVEAYYARRFREAIEALTEARAAWPADPAAARFLARSEQMVSAPTPEDWTGVVQA